MSNENKRPLPNLNQGSANFSTKKQKGKHSINFSSAPRAPTRSCPVSRIVPGTLPISGVHLQPISFRDDSDGSFISESIVYSNKKKETYFNQCFVIENDLGAGSFGKVCKVRSREDGQIYACKKTHFKYRSETDRRRKMEEVKKLEQLPIHKNCVKFFRAWEEDKHLYVLTEACKTSLSEVICQKHDIPETEVWGYLTDILQGLHHLHSNNLIHMDLKPDNIFIDDTNLCKIGDFGLVIDVSEGLPKEAVEGDPRYLAPECLRNVFCPAADMFSLGIILLELATDIDVPSSGPLWQELRNGEIPEVAMSLSPDLLYLYRCMTNTDPKSRMTSTEAMNISFVRKKIFIKNVVFTILKLIHPLLLVSFYILSVIKSLWQKTYNEVSTPNDADGHEVLEENKQSSDASFQCEMENDEPGSEERFSRVSFTNPFNSTPMSTSKYFEDDLSIINYSADESKDVPNTSGDDVDYSPKLRTSERLRDLNTKRFNKNNVSPKKFSQTQRNLLEVFSQLDSDDDD